MMGGMWPGVGDNSPLFHITYFPSGTTRNKNRKTTNKRDERKNVNNGACIWYKFVSCL